MEHEDGILTECSPAGWTELQLWSAVGAYNVAALALHDWWQRIVKADRTFKERRQI